VPGLYRTAEEKIALETRNGVIQFLAVLHYVKTWAPGQSHLTPDILLELQRLAVNQIYTCAGSFRDGPVSIQGVDHKPLHHSEVPACVAGLCTYVDANWSRTPIHLASYVMWRLNWIHPFFGGNGRTSRAASYLVLCARLGFELPGTPTIPESIVSKREPYYDALKSADAAWQAGSVDVSKMEVLMGQLLATQLVSIHHQATGNQPPL
jgi:Fic family protein